MLEAYGIDINDYLQQSTPKEAIIEAMPEIEKQAKEYAHFISKTNPQASEWPQTIKSRKG